MPSTYDSLFSLPEATPYDEEEDFTRLPTFQRAFQKAKDIEDVVSSSPELMADPNKDREKMKLFSASTLDLPAEAKPKPSETLEQWLARNDPAVKARERIQKEWGDKGILGKIMMGTSEAVRGAAQGRRYTPYSERIQKQVLDEFKAKAPVITNELKLQQANQKLIQQSYDKQRDQNIKLELGTELNRIRGVTAETGRLLGENRIAQMKKDYDLNVRRVETAEANVDERRKMNEYKRGVAPGAPLDWHHLAYQEVLQEAGGDHTKVSMKEVGKRAQKYIAQEAKDKARTSNRSLNPNDPRNVYVGSDKFMTWDMTTGRTREINARTLTNKVTQQAGYASSSEFNPAELGTNLIRLTTDQAKEMDGFEKTLTNVDNFVGTLANAVRKGTAEQFVRAQENRVFEFIRAYREGEGYVLTAEEATLKPSILNAVILHTRAMIGYRPPLQMITEMYDKINRNYGSVQAKVFSMVSLKFLTEMAQYKTLGINAGTDEVDQLRKVLDGASLFTTQLVQGTLPPGSKVPSIADYIPGLPNIHGGGSTSNRIGISGGTPSDPFAGFAAEVQQGR
jgi:hypothetical protein